MNTAKKAHITLFALIVALCLIAGIMLGGGYAFVKAEDNSDPAPAAKTVALKTSADLISTAGQAPDEANWAAAYSYRHFYDGAAHTLTVEFAEEIDASVYSYAEFRALAWSASSYSMGVSKDGGEVIDTFSVNGECGITDYYLARQKLTLILAPYADESGKISKIVLHLPAFASVSGFSGYFVLSEFTCYPHSATQPEQDVTLNFNRAQVAALSCGELLAGNHGGLFLSADDGSKVQYVSEADVVYFGGGYKYKASAFDYVEIVFCINSNSAGGNVTAEFFAEGDGANPVAVARAASGDNFLRRVRISANLLADKYGYIQKFTVKRAGTNDGGGMLFFHNVKFVKNAMPETWMNGGALDYAGGMPVPAWETAFDYKKTNISTQTVDIDFVTPIDTATYYTATFNALLWQGADGTLQVKNSSGDVIDSIAVRGHEDSAALDQSTTVAIRLSDYAGNDGKVSGIKLAVEGGGSHLLFTDLTCYETPSSTVGKISAPLSNLYSVHTDPTWKDYFDFETKQDVGPKSFTVEFIEPIEITNKYAVFNAMFWGGQTWKSVTITANGNAGASEKVWVVQGYGESYGSEKVLLPLEKFKTGDNMLRSLTLSCDTLGSDSYQGFLLISELTFTDEPPADLVIGPGDIDYRASGLNKANTVESWKSEFDYEKMNVQNSSVTLMFYEPIDTETYKYAEFKMLLWVNTGWYDVGVSANDASDTLLVPAYETVGVVDSTCGLRLEQYADNDGMIDSITFTFGKLYNAAGESSTGHLLITDFELSQTAPPEEIPKAGDIDYKRSGLIKTSASSPEPVWGELFDYEASATKGSKLTIKFAEPINANETEYAVFNALLWGEPGFVDVPVSANEKSVTLSIYKYWAKTAGEFNISSLRAKLKLSELADGEGKIRELTFDFAGVPNTGNTYNGTFLLTDFNCVNMEVAAAENGKDISSVMPIGSGKTFNASASGEAETWSKHASVRTEAFDALNFSYLATYSEHFKFGMLVRTLRPADSVSKSGRFDGALIELTDSYASVSVWNGDKLLSSRKNGNFFTSGESVKVKLEILETELAETPCGYTLRLTVGNVTLDDLYIDIGVVTFGYYTHVLTANGLEAFTADVSSASETPVSAADFMNVKLTASSVDGATKRVPLEFTFNDVCDNEISAPIINGAAHWDAVGKYLVFDGDGEVTVKYTVTNEFGMFESNTLTLSYAEPSEKVEVAQQKKGCGSAAGVGLGSVSALVALVCACAAVALFRKKRI